MKPNFAAVPACRDLVKYGFQKMDDSAYQTALDQALRLLGFKARTRSELLDRLARKGVSGEVAERVLRRLEELALVDDRGLAASFARAARRSARGDRRIRWDLLRRGVPREAVDAALAGADADAESPADRVWAALQRRAPRLKNLDPRTARRRLESYLFRQGFESDDVASALRRYFDSQIEETL